MIERKNNWESLLADAIQTRRHMPFEWGVHDCCIFATNILTAYWDHDPMHAFRDDMYADASGAAIALKRYGKGTLSKTLISIFKAPVARQISPAMARRGDVVITDHGDSDLFKGQAVGICIGSRAIFADDIGWFPLPMTKIRRAWAIGW